MKLHIPDNIANMLPCPPGKTQGELEREYGVSGSIKLASNENNPTGSSLSSQDLHAFFGQVPESVIYV